MIFQVDICFLAAPVFPHKQFYPLPCALLCCGQFRRLPAGKIRTFASTELGREIFVPYLLKRKNWVSLGTNLSFQPEAIFVEDVTKAIMFRHSSCLMSLFRLVWRNAPVRETVKRFISDSRPAFLVFFSYGMNATSMRASSDFHVPTRLTLIPWKSGKEGCLLCTVVFLELRFKTQLCKVFYFCFFSLLLLFLYSPHRFCLVTLFK